ncbi:unnamed protein product [Rotaria sordida]|uniref:inorganic diphosphatase n=1 Tax=Rotaria sordida TaxID=392033 RepID=A0A815LVM2_9BILA|nr:unnamed protein product [Rotaria sordida]CAF1304801.1 unnamed protein product [Rotaria sordida]CAF1413815.1 unnamed protein product [Rotaria sordida]
MIMFVWYFSSITIIGPSFLTLFNVQGAPIASKVNNKNEVAVFGHLNPDTDAVATAIAYASFLKTMNINAKAYRLSDLNRETQYVLKMTGIKQPSLLPANISDGTEIALVDHNESQQSIKNLKRMKVTRVLDHHKLGDLTTDVPIYIRFEPVGCTATILAKLYFENKVKICQTTAMLMISAIISDTLFFRFVFVP